MQSDIDISLKQQSMPWWYSARQKSVSKTSPGLAEQFASVPLPSSSGVVSDLCIRMTTPSQLELVRKEIEDVKAEIQETKEALAAARRDADVDFLRKQLEQLNKKENILLEEKNILLQGQASGQHC